MNSRGPISDVTALAEELMERSLLVCKAARCG